MGREFLEDMLDRVDTRIGPVPDSVRCGMTNAVYAKVGVTYGAADCQDGHCGDCECTSGDCGGYCISPDCDCPD